MQAICGDLSANHGAFPAACSTSGGSACLFVARAAPTNNAKRSAPSARQRPCSSARAVGAGRAWSHEADGPPIDMKNNVFQNATFRCGPENTLAPASGICHFWKMRCNYRLYELSNDEFEQLVVQICVRWLAPGITYLPLARTAAVTANSVVKQTAPNAGSAADGAHPGYA